MAKDITLKTRNGETRYPKSVTALIYENGTGKTLQTIIDEMRQVDTATDTRTQHFKADVNNLDTLKNKTDIGLYNYVGTGWRGSVSVCYDSADNVSQVALSSSTPSYNGNTLTWLSAQPCAMARTYTNGAWSHWEKVGASVVNDLTTGGTDKALSAEMGKTLKVGLDALGPKIDGITDDYTHQKTFSEQMIKYHDAVTTVMGVEVTQNADGTFTLNGTATGSGGRTTGLSDAFELTEGEYTVETNLGKSIFVFKTTDPETYFQKNDGDTFTIASGGTANYKIGLTFSSSTSYSNKTGYIRVMRYTTITFDKTAEDLVARNSISNLDAALDDVETGINKKTEGVGISPLSFTKVSGKYISSTDGSVKTLNNYSYTEGFYVEKGKVIVVNARGYQTSTAMISKVITEGTSYQPLVNSTDSVVREYSYVVLESGNYAASFFDYDYTPSIEIRTATPMAFNARLNALESIASDVAEMKEAVGTISKELITPSATSGKYIGVSNGDVKSSNGFAYSEKFYVSRHKKILFIARGYNASVAMISRVLTENSSYQVLVASVDSTVREYSYVVQESGYYAVSYNVNYDHNLYIVSGTLGLTAQAVEDNTARLDSLDADIMNLPNGLIGGIPKIGMIGDSLMSGAGYNPNTQTPSDNIGFAWWKHLQNKYSTTTFVRFCQGGMSTFSFVSNTLSYGLNTALTAANKCNLYIIGLEVNDRNNHSSSLGTAEDIDLTDPDNNANTYYGNYAKIIQKITAFNPVAKFILFTNPRTDGNWNNAIRAIAEMFDNCYLVDLWNLYSQHYTSGGFIDNYKDQSAHYPAMAYAAMAKLLDDAINNCINDNYADFKNIQYDVLT